MEYLDDRDASQEKPDERIDPCSHMLSSDLVALRHNPEHVGPGRHEIVEELQHFQMLTPDQSPECINDSTAHEEEGSQHTPDTPPETVALLSASHQCFIDLTTEDDICLPKIYLGYDITKSSMRLHRYDSTPCTEANVNPGLKLPFIEEDWDVDDRNLWNGMRDHQRQCEKWRKEEEAKNGKKK